MLNGRYLAYFIFNAEEASPVDYSYVYSVDVVKRKKLIEVFSGDPKKADDSTTDVKSLVVGSRGATAWITESINLDAFYWTRGGIAKTSALP